MINENVINTQVKKFVKGTAEFLFYRQGELWYRIVAHDYETLDFPVPVKDTGTGVFYNSDRAVIFMRWIRKQLENIETGKIEQGV